jgi:hypothetical protein
MQGPSVTYCMTYVCMYTFIELLLYTFITLLIVLSSIPDNHRRSSHRSRNLLPVREKERFPFPPIGDLEIILRPKFHEELESRDLFHLYQSKVIFNNVSLKP